jgi:hypothetical protein
MKKPPPALRKSFNELFDQIWRFSVACREANVPPDTCLAMMQCAFFAITCPKEPKTRQQLVVKATNRALQTMNEDEKNPFAACE